MTNSTTIQSLEEFLLNQDTRSNPEALSKLIADDFQEFGSSGHIFSKKQVLESLPIEPKFHALISNFETKEIGPASILATYSIQITQATTGQSQKSLRSSIWTKKADQWQLTFHQSTPKTS